MPTQNPTHELASGALGLIRLVKLSAALSSDSQLNGRDVESDLHVFLSDSHSRMFVAPV